MYVLRKIVEYRQLKVRAAKLGALEHAGQRARLAELERWLSLPANDPRRHPEGDLPVRGFRRFEVHVDALLELGHGMHRVSATSLSAGGLAISPVPALPRCDLGTVLIADSAERCEYHLPIEIRWRGKQTSGAAIGCAFIGYPSCGRLSDWRWRSAAQRWPLIGGRSA